MSFCPENADPEALPDWVSHFVERLAHAGLDLVQPFKRSMVDSVVGRDEELLATYARRDAQGLFIGNSRRLWAQFLRTKALDGDHPLDSYVERSVQAAARACPVSSSIGYAHTTQPRPLPMQALADKIGFAQLGPAHLCVRADVGPWCALRAIVVFDSEAVVEALAPPFPSVCSGCPAPCVEQLEEVEKGAAPGSPEPDLSPWASGWLSVRDACPVGREHRYGKNQLLYHYDKDPRALRSDD